MHIWKQGIGKGFFVPTTVKDFCGEDLMPNISVEEAYERIRERIFLLNPEAIEKDIKKFVL